MAKTYHDAPITAAQMDKVLASMNSVSKASNNGKILCVDDFGFLTAKTQQELHIGAVLEPVTISENGTVTPPDGVDGFDSVTVDVSEPAPVLQNKIVTQNGVVTPDTGYDGLGQVTVDVPGGGYPEPTGTIPITANGTVNVKDYETAEVNVPSSITVADEGKVVKNGVLVAQTARATELITNGTYDTTENNSVTVNVSGGGDSPVDVSFLPNSVQADILVSQDATSYSSGSMRWGRALVAGNMNLVESTYDSSESAVVVPYKNGVFYYLPSVDHSVTVYAAVKVTTSRSGNNGILQIPYALSTGKDPNYYTERSNVLSSTYGNNTNESTNALQWHLYTISIDSTAKKAYYYIDAVYKREKSFTNSGALISVTASDMGLNNSINGAIKYLGIVDGNEPQATVIANMQTIMSKLGLTA